ncbi:unnamed protein product [Effrenium voratum]|uniref:Uncharacterized protein n=1 Tax=Effrenium voratum TaxID=2562239 RepID=A0AA36J701_9DINO|nr:unnamed protein product [Effrenium voratum]
MPLRHELNERAIGEWQLRLMPTSSWAVEDATAAGEYQRQEVDPPEKAPKAPTASSSPANPPGSGPEKADFAVADKVRNGYRSANTAAEVTERLP